MCIAPRNTTFIWCRSWCRLPRCSWRRSLSFHAGTGSRHRSGRRGARFWKSFLNSFP